MSRSMTPYTSRKLRNDLLRINPKLDVQIRPVSVNGVVFGCSGFVTNPATGTVVYVCTDHNHGLMYDKALYRTARDTKDYSGDLNRTCTYAELAANVVKLSQTPRREPGTPSVAPRRPKPAPAAPPLSQGLRREAALVHSILPKGRHPNGGTIWELDLGNGRKVRTAAGSGSWASRMDPAPGRVQRLVLLFNGRGTVSGVQRG